MPGRKDQRNLSVEICRWTAVFLFSILISCSPDSGDSASEEFKRLAITASRELSMEMTFSDPKIGRLRQEFGEFASRYKDSVWADDARYMVAVLCPPGEEKTASLEGLLRDYPDAREEEWSRKNLLPFMPKIMPLGLAARYELCDGYRRSGQKEKLDLLISESIKKFPDHQVVFEAGRD